MDKFNSEGWFLHIKEIANAMYEVSDKAYVSYDEKAIDEIMQLHYPTRLNALKKEIFGLEDMVQRRIDRHKLVALYIQLFLERQVFKIPLKINNRQTPTIKSKLVNEALCIHIVEAAFTSWNDKQMNLEKFENEYRPSFLRLLYYYRKHAEFHKKNSFFTFALAHVLYFIEREFFEESAK